MIFVGIDLSIDSTAITIENNNEYVYLCYTNKNPNNIWIKSLENIVDFRFLNYEYKNIENFSERELYQLKEFDDISSMIYQDLEKYVTDDCIIGIEGLNYGLSNTNIIMDIVSFSAPIKFKLSNGRLNGKIKHIDIISPKSIKLEISNLVYGLKCSQSKSKNISRNKSGVAGGSFKKGDMLNAFLDYNINTPLTNIIKENKNKLISPKQDVKKPYEDIIDSWAICQIMKNKIFKF